MHMTTISCRETHYKDGLPEWATSADRLHKQSIQQACAAFSAFYGTDDMVPNMVAAVYPADKLVRFWILPWGDEDEKCEMLFGLRNIFADPLWRPSRYTFNGEVWIANMSVSEANSGIRPRQHASRLDGLAIITVDAVPNSELLFTSFVRDDKGKVIVHCDSRDPDNNSASGFEGRLADLLKDPSEDPMSHDVKLAGIITPTHIRPQ
jgi:hypothetical protein